jgi:hypothetical protein
MRQPTASSSFASGERWPRDASAPDLERSRTNGSTTIARPVAAPSCGPGRLVV